MVEAWSSGILVVQAYVTQPRLKYLHVQYGYEYCVTKLEFLEGMMLLLFHLAIIACLPFAGPNISVWFPFYQKTPLSRHHELQFNKDRKRHVESSPK